MKQTQRFAIAPRQVKFPSSKPKQQFPARQTCDWAERGAITPLNFAHHQVGKTFEMPCLTFRKGMGLTIKNTKGPEGKISGSLQRCPCIETNPWLVDHQGIGTKTFVIMGIRHNQYLVCGYGMAAKCHGPWGPKRV